MDEIVIIGAGNAFWEISELIDDINAITPKYKIIGVLDDNKSMNGKTLGEVKVIGAIDRAKDFDKKVKFVFAIGSYKTRLLRKKLLERIGIEEERYVTLVHPTAKVFSTASINHGCVIHYGSVIFNHSVIDSFCTISANCVIGVGNLIGKGALLGSNITTTTGVKIGSFSFVGSSCSIAENKEIGAGAYIGMGSSIFKNIPPGTFVLGNPIKALNKVEVEKEIIDIWLNFKKRKRV